MIYPIFVAEGNRVREEINTMPGQFRLSVDEVVRECEILYELGIGAVNLFGYSEEKDELATKSYDSSGLVQRCIREIKKKIPDLCVQTDVALDPYTRHGHDGILKSNNIMNDETIEILIQQSLLQAQMGCDVLAPSDMMDGRIGKIRKALDKKNFKNTQILSYAVKYASNFYGPFRDAVGSKVALKGDKKTYQMDFRNYDEAIREVALDIKEGADMVMVKPGLPYLDIIRSIKNKFKIPVFAYQVSGEYSMLSNAVEKKIINKDAIFENLMSFKRAGANAIVSYYADRLNEILP